MMSARTFLRRTSLRIAASRAGSAAMEFALIGPLFILMMMAVFQFSIVMQSYNALGSAAADVQRQVVTQSQAGNLLTASQMRDTAIGRASGAPYFLNTAALSVTVALASSQRISGANEYTLTMTYDAPIFVWVTPLTFTTTYTRSIFVKV
ncbi:TadE/TadG family type IV pilus assembly protein [Novosphingobium huizhouense]|uniref:TadE/TadG family type IV pilus assembly protein n=1 Tax=Novosphingobium huizhouense TaxID=2866625 RepID=UPI001CD8667D|nr:TadE/TadG family type IV pilus assembly protein [Novosphingobium huizhouense]